MCSKPASLASSPAGTAPSSIAPSKTIFAILRNASSPARRSNRRFLVFCAFCLTLLLGSSLLQTSSSIPPVNRRDCIPGRKFFTASVGFAQAAKAVVGDLTVRPERVIFKKDSALQCNRKHYRTDVCVAKGDVRVLGGIGLQGTRRSTYQVLVLAEGGHEKVERLRPYTRKWEESVMKTIDEVQIIRKVTSRRRHSSRDSAESHDGDSLNHLHMVPLETGMIGTNIQNDMNDQTASAAHRSAKKQPESQTRVNRLRLGEPTRTSITDHSSESDLDSSHNIEAVPVCEVRHDMPAILFSTGGYTGNVYHEFNDGLIPLFITALQHSRIGQVVLLVMEYHSWWMSKYAEVVEQITNYTVVDLALDARVHCFPKVIVGLEIHGELSIDDGKDAAAPTAASMESFQELLHAAYARRDKESMLPTAAILHVPQRPKLVIIARRAGSRVLLNEEEVGKVAQEIGFTVQVINPTPSSRMVDMYEALSDCDVMLGVHGAAMTHLVFMRPGATFIQVVPLGAAWAAATYYGEPARKLGLYYVEYKVSPQESSLWDLYASDDPVLQDPDAVSRSGGWWETKRIYLQAQNVTVSLPTMAATLRSVFDRVNNAPPPPPP